jgi:hypothetical protein
MTIRVQFAFVASLLTLHAASVAAGTPATIDQTGDTGTPSLVAASAPGQSPVTTLAKAAHPVALAVNLPLMWGHSIAGSAWVGINEHHAVRGNFARYEPAFIGSAFSEDSPPTGLHVDGSVSWVYFPRKTFSGVSVEVGALYRDRAEQYTGPFFGEESYDINSRILAAEGLIGWNWRIGSDFYIAAAVGASYGYERGTRQDYMHKQAAKSFGDTYALPEGYLRFGAVLE